MTTSDLGIVIGTIVSCEKVPETERLYKMEIDMGDKIATVATSVPSYLTAEELRNIVGKKVPVKGDVKVKEIYGIRSEVRFIAATGPGGEAVLLTPEGSIQPENGSQVY